LHDINLIPDHILYGRRRFLKQAARIMLILAAAALLSALLLLRPYQRWVLEGRIAKLSYSIDAAAIEELGKAEGELAAKVKESADLAAWYEKIPQEDIKPTELLKRITGLMPLTVTVTGVNYKLETSRLDLLLSAKNRADIALFMKRLYNDPLTEDIQLSTLSGQEGAYSTAVSMKLKLQAADTKGGEAGK
jgi:hypothetical protein